jgi:mercuric ion binding protein
MKHVLRAAATASTLLLTGGAMAAPRTVMLEVQNVTCVTCAPVVKKTLARLPGVSQVAVVESEGTATATVTFDDAKVTPDALIAATTNAGYPATLKDN